MSPDLESRIKLIEDIEEIRRLRLKYHVFINDREFHRCTELFTDDAIIDFGYLAKARGMEEIKALYAKMVHNLPFVKQFIHNHLVDVDGDTATGVSYLDARYASEGESLVVCAKFIEEYRRTAAGWLISNFIVELDFSVPLSRGWAGEQRNFIKPFT